MLYLRICTKLYIQNILGGAKLSQSQLELHLEDVYSFIADYTLDLAAEKFAVPKVTMRLILLSIYEQLGALNLDEQKKNCGKQKFPKILFDTVFLRLCLVDSLRWKLLKKTDGGFSLTPKCLEIFLLAAEKQRNLNLKVTNNTP